MKLAIGFLILGCLSVGCKERKLPAEHLTGIRVVRNVEKTTPANPQPAPKTGEEKRKVPEHKPATADKKYHIIVASFREADKSSAERMVAQLKAEHHPASLLYSSQRYRVSIEGFQTDAAATAALDKYRRITKRQDIWVHKLP